MNINFGNDVHRCPVGCRLSTGGNWCWPSAGWEADSGAVSRAVFAPEELTGAPFRGAEVVAKGLLSRRQIAGSAWIRLFPDIYVWEGLVIDHHTRCLAAALFLDGRGAISGLDAAAMWGADAIIRGAPIEATVPDPIRVRATHGLRIVRSPLPPGDCHPSTHLLRTTPGRTAFDVARRRDWRTAVVGIDAMLAARLVTKEEVSAFARTRKGWPRVSQVGKVLLLSDAGAESPQESRLRLILVAGGLPRPRTQYEVRDGMNRFVARLDLAYPEHRLGIEYDGDHHRTRAAFRNDLRRLNELRTCGYTVLRFAAADLFDPQRVVATVKAAIRSGAPR
jgi:very-short-patch-repair endonuclease